MRVNTFSTIHQGSVDDVLASIYDGICKAPSMPHIKKHLFALRGDVQGAKDDGAVEVRATLWIDDRSGARSLHSRVTTLK